MALYLYKAAELLSPDNEQKTNEKIKTVNWDIDRKRKEDKRLKLKKTGGKKSHLNQKVLS